ncbi:unnamed protein product [Prorocentrum cordatum]|uniref:Ion transport domain-containing protein n=2 Tax=Prorocentrum cordatum TaxID=2364126 RepID=A0ABN9QKK0_9DINO|nr:unnamed protein product [Polarella glacialis]
MGSGRRGRAPWSLPGSPPAQPGAPRAARRAPGAARGDAGPEAAVLEQLGQLQRQQRPTANFNLGEHRQPQDGPRAAPEHHQTRCSHQRLVRVGDGRDPRGPGAQRAGRAERGEPPPLDLCPAARPEGGRRRARGPGGRRRRGDATRGRCGRHIQGPQGDLPADARRRRLRLVQRAGVLRVGAPCPHRAPVTARRLARADDASRLARVDSAGSGVARVLGAGNSRSESSWSRRGESQLFAQSALVIGQLIAARANVRGEARTNQGNEVRHMQAIHMAAGTGNVPALEVLLANGADPNAKARIDSKTHYYPIHDAAFKNQVDALRFLIRSKAEVRATNVDGCTPLHIAAQLGYVDVVEVLLEYATFSEEERRPNLLTMENARQEMAVTLAVQSGRFPASKMRLFTQDLAPLDRAEAFCIVARACPSSASALLSDCHEWDLPGERTHDENPFGMGAHSAPSCGAGRRNSSTNISEQWRQSIIAGAKEGGVIQIKVDTLVELIEFGAEAAMYLLEALTTTPRVTDLEHNALPVRAYLRPGSEPVQMACAYSTDRHWKWDPAGPPAWQTRMLGLANRTQKDLRHAVEVKTQVVNLQGIISMKMLLALSLTPDRRIFTKMAVHGLLKHAWSELWYLFVIENIHEVIATLILSTWILSSQLTTPGYYTRFAVWAWIASRGIAECLHVACMVARVTIEIGRAQGLKWAELWSFRFVAGGVTTLLCAQLVSTEYWPASGDNAPSILLAANSLIHWLWLLLQLRAFPATGSKLLPILKSIRMIGPMVLIVFFVMMAFVHGFWSFDMEMADDVKFFEVVTMLFTGENLFLDRDELGEMPAYKRTLYILLTLAGLFMFLACALNVFIAVLGECYDLEQERMPCSLLQERARVCCSACLGPRLYLAETWPMAAALPLSIAAALVGVAVHEAVSQQLGAWIVAAALAVSVLFLGGRLEVSITRTWPKRYLWLCYGTSVDESHFLAAAEAEEGLGRLMRIKQHLHRQAEGVESKIDELRTRQDSLAELCSALLERLPPPDQTQTPGKSPLGHCSPWRSRAFSRAGSSAPLASPGGVVEAAAHQLWGLQPRGGAAAEADPRGGADLHRVVLGLQRSQEEQAEVCDALARKLDAQQERQEEQGRVCQQLLGLQQSSSRSLDEIKKVLVHAAEHRRAASERRARGGRGAAAAGGPRGAAGPGEESVVGPASGGAAHELRPAASAAHELLS